MNDLLDRNYDGKKRYLNNPNNPNEAKIPIHIHKNKGLDSKIISISDEQVLQLADFMIKLNKKRDDGNLSAAETWSIRNRENMINRIAEQQKCKRNFNI